MIEGKDLTLSIRRNTPVVVYEIAIPWRTLGADKPPTHLGVAVEVNDRDEPTGARRTKDVKGLCLFELHKPAKHGVLCIGSQEPR